MQTKLKSTFKHSPKAGFTMIELCIVAMIIGVAGWFGVASYLRLANQSIVDSAASSILSGLRGARMDAVTKNLPVDLSLPSNVKYIRKRADLNGDGSYSTSETEYVEIKRAADVSISTSGSSPKFTSMGSFTASSLPWRITISRSGVGAKTLYVYVFASGQVEQYDKVLSL